VVVHITLAPRANMGQTGSLLLCALEHSYACHDTLSGSERGRRAAAKMTGRLSDSLPQANSGSAGWDRHSMRLRCLERVFVVAWLIVRALAVGEMAWVPLPRIVTLYHAVAYKSCVDHVSRHRLARLPKPPTRHDVLAALAQHG
jgi:hypothetical protein